MKYQSGASMMYIVSMTCSWSLGQRECTGRSCIVDIRKEKDITQMTLPINV